MHTQVLKISHTWTFWEVTTFDTDEMEDSTLESLLSLCFWELVDKKERKVMATI